MGMACALLGTVKEIPYLVGKDQCGRERGGFVVARPRWPDRSAKARDAALQVASLIGEGHLRPGIKLSYSDRGDGHLQTFAC